jgi:hypothetical protein
MKPKDAKKAVHLWECGLTITQVVARIGYLHGTIRKGFLEHDVAIRSGSQLRWVVSGE